MSTSLTSLPINSLLVELSSKYGNIDVALAKIARLRAALTLPKGTVHVISDIHGEFKKLKHVLNNASGTLRVLASEVFGDKLAGDRLLLLLKLIYYPRETYVSLTQSEITDDQRVALLRELIGYEIELLRVLGSRYTLEAMEGVFPGEYRELFRELLIDHSFNHRSAYREAILSQFFGHGKELDLLRLLARMIRNLLISELIVAGDVGDRGERIDKVIEYLMRQPRVSVIWGNHDVTWIGACLGDKLCIATVLRLSLRYGRLGQLEEGYGIPLAPLERLANSIYKSATAPSFIPKIQSYRSSELCARMQKAIAIIQMKLEGQAIQRNPQWKLDQLELEQRTLLSKVVQSTGKVIIAGVSYDLTDTVLPTLNPSSPFELTADEQTCIDELQSSFLQSPMLWRHMSYLVERGSLYQIRDSHLIFHACVPSSSSGEFLTLCVDGKNVSGKALYDAVHRVIWRAYRFRAQADLDLLWYLWCGPRSPLFGKDKMTTFESYFIADKATHTEHNNPYFTLLHERSFCERVLSEWGINSPIGLIVNGHVPVKIDKGESPLKASGLAVTIDGAFSEAYGDHGYTLVLESSRTFVARHHHFGSVRDAIIHGEDIVPTIQPIHSFATPHTVGDTEEGLNIRNQIDLLECLISAYEEHQLPENRQ